MATEDPRDYRATGSSNTIVNALIGVAVSVVVAFLPFSTAIGGIVAGYLESDDVGAGARVGALAGVISMLPFAVLAYLVVAVIGIFSIEFATFGFVLATLFGLGLLGYVVVPFVVGGALGSYVKRERIL